MFDAVGVEGRGAADDAVNVVTFIQKQFGQVGTILAGDAGDEGAFGVALIHEGFLERFPAFIMEIIGRGSERLWRRR
jgi:hypothetical protein